MLGSNQRVHETISKIPAQIDDTITRVMMHGTLEDRAVAMRTFKNTLDVMNKTFARDMAITAIINAEPFTEEWTYAHFLHTLMVRYSQSTTAVEREMLRLKYYPLASVDPNYTKEEWMEVIESLQVDIHVDAPWVNTLLRILSLGMYKGNRPLVPLKEAPTKSLPGTSHNLTPSDITDTGLVSSNQLKDQTITG